MTSLHSASVPLLGHGGAHRHLYPHGSLKKRIIFKRQRGERERGRNTQSSIEQWAAEEFSLKDVPSKAAKSRIIFSSVPILSTTDKEISKKKHDRPGVAHALESVMFNWVCEQQSRWAFLNEDMNLCKDQKLLELSNERAAEDEGIVLKVSLGWLQDSMKR